MKEYSWTKTISYAKQLLKQLQQLVKQLLLTVMPSTGIVVAAHI